MSSNVIGTLSKALDTDEFVWLIKLSDEILEKNRCLKSPTFLFLHVSWYVSMIPNSFFPPGTIMLYLHKKESQSEIKLHYSLEMILNGMQLKKWECEDAFGKGATYGKSQYLHRSFFLDQWSKKTGDCGQLTIKIRMGNNVPPEEDALLEKRKEGALLEKRKEDALLEKRKEDALLEKRKEDALLEKRKEGIKILCQNYRDLLLHDDEHDLILKVKDREFKAHRCIMRFRCPVFKSMLSHDMLEKSSGVVEIPDCEPLAFEQFLNYVYNGDLETLDESFMLGLYYIADKYEMAYLKEMCREFIKKSLSPRNICDVIKLALNHSDSTLLECGKKYYIDNVKKVLVTVEWQSFGKENFIQANELIIKAFDHYIPEKKTET